MELVLHRLNRIEQLEAVPPEERSRFGAEVDVRYHEDSLVVSHDPFHHSGRAQEVANFAAWADCYRSLGFGGPLIVNVKSEGLEDRCIEVLGERGLTRWFFLDLSMPYFVKYARLAASGSLRGFGTANLAVRYSEFEALEYALGFQGMADWVWVDCFTKLPLDRERANLFKAAGMKTCLVSPELQKHPLTRINEFRQQMSEGGFEVDAVCTKRPDLWDDGEYEGAPL